MNNDAARLSSELAKRMNYRLHAKQLNIPILNDFVVQEDGNPQTVLLATGSGFIEQLTSDGFVEEGDFEKRINLVIDNTKQFMRINGCENVNNSFMKLREYSNGTFNFSIYVQDMVLPIPGQKRVLRSFVAFFYEPRMKDFYQFTLSIGPIALPAEHLKVWKIDLIDDQVTIGLDSMLKTLLDNLSYKDK